MKRIYIFVTAGLVIVAAVFGIVYYRFAQQKNQDVIYLAVVGPLSTVRGEVMLNGAQMYLDEINSMVGGKRIEILGYDDENNVDIAEQKALEIAQDPRKPLIVLGHRGSDQSLRGGAVYKQYQIPAITASAPSPSVTKGNEWYFSAIIENTSQGHFIAHYAKDVLGYENITVIYQDNDYGGTLGRAVLEQARTLGMNVVYEIGYENISDKEQRWAQFPQIISDVLALEDPGIVVLALGDEDGAHFIKGFRDERLELPIMEALITQTFNDTIDTLTGGNRAAFLQNVWTTQHLIYDTGNKTAQGFQEKYINKFGVEPDATAAAYYDAALIAVKAIRDTQVDGTAPEQDRQKICEYLRGVTRLNPDLRGATGYLYFNAETRSAVKPVPIGIYDSGKLISAPIQLQAIPNIELVRDLPGELSKGNIFRIDGNYFYKTQVVYTGIDLNEVSNLDVKNSTFTADFYIWFRYEGDFDESKVEFVNAVSPVALGNPIAQDTYNGQTYHAYRVKADFKSNFNFRAYPFDKQTLNITIRNRDLTREQMTFVRDDLRLLNNQALKEQLNKVIVGGWEVIDIKIYSDVLRSDSTLGNPRLSNAGVEYSVYNVDTTIQRDAVNFSIKNLFPIVAVLVLAYLAFFIPAGEFGMRVSLGINAIMTTAFFSLKVSSDLPPIGYLVSLEYIFFMTYSLAIFVITVSLIAHIASKHEKTALIKRLDWAGRIIFPLAIAGTAYWISTIIAGA
jgi:branched-chain amino acid transport system substrate-binding protein